jgi:uncharacterized DUF497 family protein
MQINRVIVPPDVAQKIKVKHGVNDWEAEEVFFNPEAERFIRKSKGRYVAYGRTYAGRYLFVGFKLHRGGIAEVRTARRMTDSEERYYRRRR